MKIFILVDYCESSPPTSLERCRNKFQLYAYMVYKRLKGDNDVIIDHLDYPYADNADHIIVIGENAYRHDLKTRARGTVTTLNVSNVSYQGEQLMFYMDNCCSTRANTICINWLLDHHELYPDKDDRLHIVIQKPDGDCKLYDKIVNTMLKVKKKHNITLGALSNNYYKDLLSDSITVLDNYKVRYDLWRKIHVYIATTDVFDRELLYNLAMTNVLIVSNEAFISPRVLNDIDCIFYDNDISWKNIINRLKHVKSRDEILKSKTADHAVSKMIQFMEPLDEVEETIDNDEVVIHKIKRAKCLTLLQSDLRSMR